LVGERGRALPCPGRFPLEPALPRLATRLVVSLLVGLPPGLGFPFPSRERVILGTPLSPWALPPDPPAAGCSSLPFLLILPFRDPLGPRQTKKPAILSHVFKPSGSRFLGGFRLFRLATPTKGLPRPGHNNAALAGKPFTKGAVESSKQIRKRETFGVVSKNTPSISLFRPRGPHLPGPLKGRSPIGINPSLLLGSRRVRLSNFRLPVPFGTDTTRSCDSACTNSY
jgi:hypothetical protein